MPSAEDECLLDQLTVILELQGLDRLARDGDCLIVEPRITAVLRQFGVDAQTAVVTAWLDPAMFGFPPNMQVIAFQHRVTLVGCCWVADATAQQFGMNLPERWITPVPDYLRRLASVSGTLKATLAATEQPSRCGRALRRKNNDQRLCRMPGSGGAVRGDRL